jgi:hypothetical protein
MDQELKTRWMEALRSGDYKQGRQKLRIGKGKNTRMCCLGVLADVINPDGWTPQNHWFVDGDDSRDELSDSVLHRVGIRVGQQAELISLNDEQMKSFDDIAHFIEREL